MALLERLCIVVVFVLKVLTESCEGFGLLRWVEWSVALNLFIDPTLVLGWIYVPVSLCPLSFSSSICL